MSLQVENLEHNMVKVTIEVDAAKLDAAITKAYNKKKNQFNIPGFRKGKVPQKLIEKEYGVEIFYEDAANILIPDAYAEEMKDCDLEIVSRPEIDVVQLEKGKPFIFTAELAVKPEVTLGDYKGLDVPKTRVTVKKEEVEEELKRTQEQNAREITIEDRPVKDGDILTIDYSGSVDGEKFEGGTAQDQTLIIGSGAFIPGFEEQLIGKELNEETEINVTFPEEYHAADLAGKEAVFEVKIKAIKEKELPELDDEFASEVSEFETLDEYKADIKEKIRERKKEEAKTERENKLVDLAVENAQMDIPDAMVEEQVQQMTEEFAQRLSYQGLSMEQYLQFSGMDAQKFADDMKPQAVKRIETRLVLEAIVKAENIEVSEEEYKAEVEKMAAMYQMETEQLEKLIQDAQKEQMMDDIAVQKAVDFLVAEAK
ncbi:MULTISPECIES: trigger factor [Anaerostipes]|uniref:Trigger factor n=1 Tax=Anaerostipes butyraticus TaxID=645466 RepID=A0A916Q766_9FIRM|nr:MULTISPECIES: trigger factor [Anaerostipes]GFO84271.1 trigger factor [Anaerostipes butyraticus]HJC83692.1 trigger factor [Candidatus Anaerostipes avicola]